MIRVSVVREFLRPEAREDYVVPWGLDTTARSLAPAWVILDGPRGVCLRNGLRIDGEAWDSMLADHDHLVYMREPGIAAPAFLVAALPAGLISFGANLVNLFLINFAVSRIFGPSRRPTDQGDQSSNTYSFVNLQSNARAHGSAIPVVYGEHRFAPPVVNQYVRNYFDVDGAPKSEVLMLFLLSEGPIQAVGNKTADGGPFSVVLGNACTGVQIDNQPSENFDGVEVHVRLGTVEQASIPEFADSVRQFTVAQTLRDSETNVPPENAEATPGVFGAGDANITKWDTKVGYTMGETSDSFVAVITFPQGLFSFSSSGSLNANTAEFQVRYRRVDGAGVPFGNYIVLPAEFPITQAIDSAFSVEFFHRFFDTVGYVPQTAGRYIQFPTGSIGATYTAKQNAITQQGLAATEFSWVGWIRTQDLSPANNNRYLWSWINTGTNTGFSLRFENVVPAAGVAKLLLKCGNGTTSVDIGTGDTSAFAPLVQDTVNPHHFAITYKANFDGTGKTRFRAYVDGLQVFETATSTTQGLFDFAQLMRLGTSPTIGSVWIGHFDDMEWHAREFTAFDIINRYNAGNGVTGDASTQGLMLGFRFDSEIVNAGNRFSPEVYGPGQDTAVSGLFLGVSPAGGTAPTISTGANFGVIRTPEIGTRIRERFLVEIQRVNAEDTAQNQRDQSDWTIVQLISYEQQEYPGLAMAAVKIPANDQLSSTQPLVTFLLSGRKVPIWDGVDPLNPTTVLAYSRNPAWVIVDMLTDPVAGLGAFYDINRVDLPEFEAWALWNDEKIHDGQDAITPTAISAVLPDAAHPLGFLLFTITGSLPGNWPIATAGIAATEHFVFILAVSPSPAIPSWLLPDTGVALNIVRVYGTPTATFIEATPTTTVLSSNTYIPTSGVTCQRHEVRMRYDGVFDRTDFSAWEAITNVAQTARSVPVRKGRRISVFVDRSRATTALVNMASVEAGSFDGEFADLKSRPNAESCEFFDAALNFERSSAELEHPDLTDPTKGNAFRWRRFKLEGITRRSQIVRHIQQDLNIFNLARRAYSFELGLDAIYFQPGDVLALSHDIPGYGVSGRLWGVVVQNLIGKPEDFSGWTKDADAAVPVVGATGPLGYGTYSKLGTTSGATGVAEYTLDVGAWPASGIAQPLSAFVREETVGLAFRLIVRDVDNATDHHAEFTWTAGAPVQTSVSAGVTTNVANLGSGHYRIEWRFTTTATQAGMDRQVKLQIPVATPFASKLVQFFGVMLQEGVSAATTYYPSVTVTLDRSVVIAAATAYQIQVESAVSASRATAAIETGISVPGTYAPGSLLAIKAGGFGFTPAAEDKYAFGASSTGETKLVAVVEATLNPRTFKRRIKVVEYNPAIYSTGFASLPTNSGSSLSPPDSGTLPGPASNLTIGEDSSASADGSVQTHFRVSFAHDKTTQHLVRGTRIYIAESDGTNPRHVASLGPTEVSARVAGVQFERDRTYRVIVQPFGIGGAARSLHQAGSRTIRPSGFTVALPAPIDFRGSVAGEEVTYSWTNPSGLEGARAIELRRGGWILGDMVGSAPGGATSIGPTANFVGAPMGALGFASPTVYARGMRGTGQYGDAASLIFEPSVVGSDANSLESSREETAWSGTLTALVAQVYPPGSSEAKSGLSQLAPTGGGLQHRYEFTGGTFSATQWAYLQIGIEANQVYPWTFEDLDSLGTWSSVALARWTSEGPLALRSGEPLNCVLTIEISTSTTSTPGTNWIRFRPGRYKLRRYALRITIDRPTTSHSFRLRRLVVRATRIGEDRVASRYAMAGI